MWSLSRGARNPPKVGHGVGAQLVGGLRAWGLSSSGELRMAGGTAGDGDRDGAGARLAASAELEQSVELGRALVTDAVPTSSPRAAYVYV